MCSNFITVPRDIRIANFFALRVPNGVSDGVSYGVMDGVLNEVLEYWRVGLRTTNCSQSVYNFRKRPTGDLIGHIGHKTHVPDFYDSSSSSHKLISKFDAWNSVG
jgi:hypothetical protein